jgi:multiple sugar transport system substrate-binding protein
MSEKTTPKRVTRRQFLRGAALAGAGIAIASCAPQTIVETVEVIKEVEVEKEVEVVKEVEVEVEKEVIVKETVEVMVEEAVLRIWFLPNFNDLIDLHIIETSQAAGREIGYEVLAEPLSGTAGWLAATAKYLAAMEAGTCADVVCPQLGSMQFMEQGLLAPMPDVYDKVGADLGGWHPVCDRNFALDGVGYLLDLGLAPGFMHVREDRVNDAGYSLPFKDLEEMRQCALAINDPDNNVYGTCFVYSENDDLMHVNPIFWAFGGAAFDEEANPTINTRQENFDALQWYTDLYTVDGITPEAATTWTGGGNNQSYLSGQGSMSINPGSIMAAVRRGDHSVEGLLEKTWLGPVPQWNDEFGPQCQTEAGQAYGIWSESPHLDAAKEILGIMWNPENYNQLMTMGQSYLFPALLGAFKEPFFAEDRWNQQVEQFVYPIMHDESWPAPVRPWTPLWATWAGPACKRVTLDGWTVEQALDEAQATVEETKATYEAE